MMNKNKLEIYVHIPFCISKCSYCDFLSFPAAGGVQKEYVDKLVEEASAKSSGFSNYQVSTIFIGGGTPSILEAEWMSQIMETLFRQYKIEEGAEITLEANPGTLTPEKLRIYKKSGINRLSIGLQSADNSELKLLGRIHTYESFLKSFECARNAGFTNINVDLMSGLPGQSTASWKTTLKKVTMLKPEHISAYSLIIEEGTPFYDIYNSKAATSPASAVQTGKSDTKIPPLPDEETEREMYHLTNSFLKSHGYSRYEISNYARPGFECRHNIGYWTGTEYLGLGLGASSYIKGRRFHNESGFGLYLGVPRLPGDQTVSPFTPSDLKDLETLSLNAKMEEFMFLGLRLTSGISELEFAGRFGYSIWDIYGLSINYFKALGLLEVDSPWIRLTEAGIDISNYIMGQFLLE